MEDEIRQHLQLHRTSALGLGDVLAGPGSAKTALAIGDKALLSAMPQSDLEEMVGRVARLERALDEETDVHTEKKLYSVLLVHTSLAGEAQKGGGGPAQRAGRAVAFGRDPPG